MHAELVLLRKSFPFNFCFPDQKAGFDAAMACQSDFTSFPWRRW